MRRVITWNVMTLDGFFEGPEPWSLDWHDQIWGEEIEQFGIEQLDSADMLLFGRKTYEGMAAYWPTAEGSESQTAERMNGIAKVVFSRTLQQADWNNTRLERDAVQTVQRLKEQPGKDILIFGSADLIDSLDRSGVIDEHRICLAPLTLGHGNPLWKPGNGKRIMELLDSRPLKSGGVLLRYRPITTSPSEEG